MRTRIGRADLLGKIASQLRRRRSRALALGAGTLVAATSITLLTTAVSASQTHTVGTVQHNVRSTYDVLVRPKGTETQLEKSHELVQANFLSGIYGGITSTSTGRSGRSSAPAPHRAASSPGHIAGTGVPTLERHRHGSRPHEGAASE